MVPPVHRWARAAGLSDGAARLVDAYFAKWLEHDPDGRAHVAKLGHAAALDALWELLVAGFIQLTGDGEAITGIRIAEPPRRQ